MGGAAPSATVPPAYYAPGMADGLFLLATREAETFVGILRWLNDLVGGNGDEDIVALGVVGVLATSEYAVATTLAAEGMGARGLLAAESWGNPATLADHFSRHGADFGAATAEEYATQASVFFQRSQLEGLPTKIDSVGTIRVYDPANTFGAFNANGTTRTFYMPDPAVHGYPTNLDYWNAQPGMFLP